MKKIILMLILMIFVAVSAWAKDIYYCPMHPHYTSERPGNCPICGMTLVKKENAIKQGEDEKQANVTGYAPVHIDSSKQQMIGLHTTMVVRKPFLKTVRAAGTVAHDVELYDAQLEYIDAWQQFYAFSSRRPVGKEFQQDWRLYYTTDSGRRTSQEQRDAQKKLIKAEYTLRHLGVTTVELEKLRAIKYGRPWVNPDLLFSNEGNYWVYAEIFENDLGFVDVGQKAMVEIPAYGQTIEGVVRAVAESVDPMTRTTRVRIELVKTKIELKEGLYVNVSMPVELNNTLMVPRDAVMMTGTRAVAFVKKDEGTFAPVDVVTGWESDGFVEVKKGLEEGQMVVSGANFLVDSESRLQAALAGFSEEEDSAKKEGHNHGQ
ncbi:MAG: efflux RND transporter periplasmic adaptor subunit [Candidatus Omnitrophica bacterium]|nr:efflux RND transporter periplasmic adaptor subunit [Candidatus Omnitrophota bacterium]